MLHIKLKGVERKASWKQMICPDTHPRPLGWGQKVKYSTYSEYGHVAYQIKGDAACSNMVSHI